MPYGPHTVCILVPEDGQNLLLVDKMFAHGKEGHTSSNAYDAWSALLDRITRLSACELYLIGRRS